MIIVVMVTFLVMLIIGVPIAVCMGLTAAVWLFANPDVPTMLCASRMYNQMDNFSLMAVPFFMLAGQVMEYTGITSGLVKFANSLVGHIRGGLSHTACVSGMLMAGISGSGQADTAAIGNVLIPTLKKDGYEEGYACAVVAAAGGLGPIIPPSIFMIYYANATQYPVGKLFAGGMLPGILTGLGFIIVGYFYARKHNIPTHPFQGFKYILVCAKENFFVLLMPVIIVAGILTGAVTATEAGVLASLYGIGYGFATKKLTVPVLIRCLSKASVASIGALMIVVLSAMFGYVLTRVGIAQAVMDLCAHFTSDLAFYMFILVVCLIAGMFLDGAAIIFLLVPLLLPVITAMGLDFQHFSMFFLLAACMNQLTPPVGALLFIAAGINNTPLKQVIKPVMPFIAVCIIVTLLVIPFPALVTWLPSLM